jgi:phosphotransferase system HPr (HPr) family protein
MHAERDTVVGSEEGLHARPASEFVKRAKQFYSDIVVIKGEREANAKSPLKLMALAAKSKSRKIEDGRCETIRNDRLGSVPPLGQVERAARPRVRTKLTPLLTPLRVLHAETWGHHQQRNRLR